MPPHASFNRRGVRHHTVKEQTLVVVVAVVVVVVELSCRYPHVSRAACPGERYFETRRCGTVRETVSELLQVLYNFSFCCARVTSAGTTTTRISAGSN